MSDDKQRQAAYDTLYGPRDQAIRIFRDRFGKWTMNADEGFPSDVLAQVAALLKSLNHAP